MPIMRKVALISALLLIFTIPWETAITISSLGTLTRLIGFGAAGLWVVSVLITGRLRKLQAYHIALLVFVLLNSASIFWTVNYDLTITRVKTYFQLAILAWIFWDLFTTPESFRLAMQVFIFGAYLTIGSQLVNFVSGQTIAAYSDGRFSGAGQNAGEFALILSLSLPMAWHLVLTQKPGKGAQFLKIVNIAYIPLALLATILTASRTSLLTNIPGLLYIVWTLQNIKPVYRLLAFVVVVAAIVGIYPIIPQSTVERLSTIGSSIAQSDLGGRGALWEKSFEIFWNHPFLGIGSNALSDSNQLGAYAHNTFLSVMTELGLVGLSVFLSILAIVVYKILTLPIPHLSLWVTVLITWFIGVFSLTWEYTKSTWFFLGMMVICAGIYCRPAKTIPSSNLDNPPKTASPFVF